MSHLLVACVQQRVRLPQSIFEYQEDTRRFLRIAESKRAKLVVFPELAGQAILLPMLSGLSAILLRRADIGRRRNANLRQRIAGSLADTLARWIKTDLRRSVAALLDVDGEQVWRVYNELFSQLSKEFQMTVVAPSAYMPDPRDGVVRNLCGIFGPNGALLGHQAKVMPYSEDEDVAKPGARWDVIPTDVGRLGVMIGADVLYPEAGRVLAYQGAEVLVAQAACTHPAIYNKLRSGILARMQDNQLFGVASFAVGSNEFGRNPDETLIGKSAIFAPQEMTPRFNGVLVEMGTLHSEGVLTAEWDFAELRKLWTNSDSPIRRLSGAEATQLLANLYLQLQSQPPPKTLLEVGGEEPVDSSSSQSTNAGPNILSLSDLPILGTISSPWPLPRSATPDLPMPPTQPNTHPHPNTAPTIEDETDEMDALKG